MIKSKVIILLNFLLSINTFNLNNGIYEIKFKEFYLNFQFKINKFVFSPKPSFRASFLYRLKIVPSNNSGTPLFLIESLKHNKKLYIKDKEVIATSKYNSSNYNFLWIIIKKKEIVQ